MVAAANPLAVQAGVDVLTAGGTQHPPIFKMLTASL